MGGLGNQLFQYAMARALALRSNSELILDTRHYESDRAHEYALHHFKIQPKATTSNGLPPTKANIIRYQLWRILRLSPRLIREKGLAFNRNIENISENNYLQGYWQSERYFIDAEKQIRKEFTITTPPDEKNKSFLNEIENLPAVSVHIRRGDYASNIKVNKTHGTCSLGYYEKATRLIAEMTGIDPVFFVFSDDQDWVESQLTLPFETRLMRHNDSSRNYEDLRLMSACKHHIIANSTFSWWGAWLNPDNGKIVISPQNWFRSAGLSNEDIIPTGWLTIPN